MTSSSPRKAIVYARVSSDAQKEKHTIASQLRICPEFAHRQGWQIVATYVDDGLSAATGKSESRDGYQQALEVIRTGKADAVVVVSQDRLSRSEDPSERAEMVSACYQHKAIIALAYTGQIIDPRTQEGDIQLTFGGLISSIEKRRISERTQAGKLEAMRQGRRVNGPPGYGLLHSRAKGWEIHPQEGEVVKEIYQRICSGESAYSIEMDLQARGIPRRGGGLWRGRVVKLVGNSCFKGQVNLDSKHGLVARVPAIVTEDVWSVAQSRLEVGPRKSIRGKVHCNLLEGIASCGLCGSPLRVSGKGRGYRYYVCADKQRDGKGLARCPNPGRQVVDVEGKVWESICSIFRDDPLGLIREAAERSNDTQEEGRDWAKDLALYESKLVEFDRRRARIVADYNRGSISEEVYEESCLQSDKLRKSLVTQRDLAKSQLAASNRTQESLATLQETMSILQAAILGATPQEKQRIARALALAAGGTLVILQPDGQLQVRTPVVETSPVVFTRLAVVR